MRFVQALVDVVLRLDHREAVRVVHERRDLPGQHLAGREVRLPVLLLAAAPLRVRLVGRRKVRRRQRRSAAGDRHGRRRDARQRRSRDGRRGFLRRHGRRGTRVGGGCCRGVVERELLHRLGSHVVDR